MAPANPVFLWWGDELVQFYNDAYSQSLRADKHPKAPGQLGAERLPKIWLTIAPQIDALIMRSEGSWHEDRLFSIYRDGKLEDVLHHQESNRYWPRPVGQRRDLENHKAKVRVRSSQCAKRVELSS